MGLNLSSDYVRATTDPFTGGISLSAGGWFYGAGGIVPASATSEGIIAAMAEVANRGGGIVQLLPVEYTIDADIQLISGVHLVGVPNAPFFGASDDVPDFWEIGTNGTRFNLSAGVTAFTWNAADKGSPEANIMANALRQVRIYGIAFSGGLRAIKIGAYQAVGCMFGELDEVYAYNQTGDYAFDIQNCQFFRQGRIRVRNALVGGGGGYRYANSLNTDLFTGDSLIEEIYARCNSPISKGVVFEATGPSGSLLNDVKVTGRIHSSRYGSGTPTTVSMAFTSGSANIVVADNTQFDLCQVGMPVRFASTAPTSFDATITYFVLTRDTGTNTITLGEADYTVSGVSAGSTASHNTLIAGFPTFMARANAGCAVKNSSFGNLACEVTGTLGAVMFSKTRNCDANLNNPSSPFAGHPNTICRDAEIGVTYSGANNITMDESALAGGLCNFTNLAGGAYQHTSGNITLDSSWNGRQVRYSGTGDITITIPRILPRGFKLDLMTTGATGTVTFAGASGLGVWGKAGLRTNGQYAFVSLRNVSGVGYVLHGDAQV